MEAIRTYIENVFKAFEQNERVSALKRDMLAGMEEKYHALKGEGKSEHEAVGSVIADFGNIDEITAELGTGKQISTVSDALHLSREEAFDFLEQTKKISVWIGIGVWLILAGVAAMLLIGNFDVMNGGMSASEIRDYVRNADVDTAGAFGLFALFLAIAGAVVIFIVHGMKLNNFEAYGVKSIILDTSTRNELKSQSKRFMPRFTAYIASGVAIILLAVAFLILLSTTTELEAFAVSLFLFAIGLSVFMFIISGMTYAAFDILLGRGEYQNKNANNQSERIIGTVASVFWPLIVAVYLLWSFIGDSWHISWIIWPIAGILFGAFAGGISTWNEGKK